MCSPGMTARDEVLAALATLGPGSTDAVTLLGHVRDLATFADQVQGELARLAGMLDAVDGAAEAGYSSTAAFLRHGCGRSSGRAGELVMTGRALRRLEATGKALMAGEISFDAAHIICRAADQITDGPTAEAAEEQMLAFARSRPLPGSGGPRSGPVRDDSGQATDDGPGTAGPDGEPGSDPGSDPADRPPAPRRRGHLPAWTPPSCGVSGKRSFTAPIRRPPRSGSGNGLSAATSRSGSRWKTPAPSPAPAGTPCRWRSSRPRCTRSGRRWAPRTPAPRRSGGWMG